MSIDHVTYLRYARRGDEPVDRSAIPRRPIVDDADERARPNDLWFGPRSLEPGLMIALAAGIAYFIFRVTVYFLVVYPRP